MKDDSCCFSHYLRRVFLIILIQLSDYFACAPRGLLPTPGDFSSSEGIIVILRSSFEYGRLHFLGQGTAMVADQLLQPVDGIEHFGNKNDLFVKAADRLCGTGNDPCGWF